MKEETDQSLSPPFFPHNKFADNASSVQCPQQDLESHKDVIAHSVGLTLQPKMALEFR
jgi:hypothetical protein